MAAKKNADEKPATAFLRTLYHGTSGGLVELRAIHNKTRKITRLWTQSATELEEFVERFDKHSDTSVYFGVCKRKSEGGKKHDVMCATALWADIDTLAMGWDTEACLKAVASLPGVLQPSAIVRSGGGLHCYWLLSEPFDMEDRAATHEWRGSLYERVEDANKVMAELVSGDNVFDVTRILRIPGSWNTKRGISKAGRCEVVYCWNHARRDIHELIDAALSFGKVLYDGKWVKPEQADKKQKTPLKGQDKPETALGYAISQGNRQTDKSLLTMWRDRVRYHAGRGYMGIDEALLITTARLHCAYPKVSDKTIVDKTFDLLKLAMPSDEQWDMVAERKNIERKLARWRVKWQEIRAQNDQQGRRTNQHGRVRVHQPDGGKRHALNRR